LQDTQTPLGGLGIGGHLREGKGGWGGRGGGGRGGGGEEDEHTSQRAKRASHNVVYVYKREKTRATTN